MKFTSLLVALAILLLCVVLAIAAPEKASAAETSAGWNLFDPQPAASAQTVDFQLFDSPKVLAAKPVVAAAQPVRSAPRMQWVQVCYGRGNCRWEWQYVQ